MSEQYNAGLVLDRNLEAGRGDKVAITWSGGTVTYRALHGLACATGLRLRELGIRREERVLVVMDDSPAFAAAFLGAIRIGAVPVPVNPLLQRSEDYDHYIEDSLALVVVVDANTEEKLKGAVERAKDQPRLVRAEAIRAGAGVEPAPTR